ncbi:pseudouridine synthase [Dunaliella salina]|uniref:tRNA pseudouridine(55) synthase n=1 Tax=Dunaliella salina TaxID=3046 RepID=A0ABQ7GPK5_DUNSA|nr:pseudouridine synthase [Dunaliella salina]|eukprot:KAF5836537.1 pseudouridine synthase [Dunaliella salina]
METNTSSQCLQCVLRLGEGTPSYDGEMQVDQQLPWEHITDEDLERVAKQFVGDIMQVPPMYSAIKVKGQKLYNLARDGQTVAREERPVTIMSLKLWRSDVGNMATGSLDSKHPIPSASSHKDSNTSDTRSDSSTSDAGQGQHSSGGAQGSIQEQPGSALCSSGRSVDRSSSSSSGSTASASPNSPDRQGQGAAEDDLGGRAIFQQQGTQIGPHRPRQDVFFSVRCSKGTYIRSLVYDIGRALGTVAFMASLRREAIGDFHVRDAWQLQDLVSHLRTVRGQAQEAEQQAEH